jgi:hypothetical protein
MGAEHRKVEVNPANFARSSAGNLQQTGDRHLRNRAGGEFRVVGECASSGEITDTPETRMNTIETLSQLVQRHTTPAANGRATGTWIPESYLRGWNPTSVAKPHANHRRCTGCGRRGGAIANRRSCNDRANDYHGCAGYQFRMRPHRPTRGGNTSALCSLNATTLVGLAVCFVLLGPLW